MQTPTVLFVQTGRRHILIRCKLLTYFVFACTKVLLSYSQMKDNWIVAKVLTIQITRPIVVLSRTTSAKNDMFSSMFVCLFVSNFAQKLANGYAWNLQGRLAMGVTMTELMNNILLIIYIYLQKLECGPMPNVMVALPNVGDALCSTPQFGWRPLLECRAVTLPRRETRWNL